MSSEQGKFSQPYERMHKNNFHTRIKITSPQFVAHFSINTKTKGFVRSNGTNIIIIHPREEICKYIIPTNE